MSEFTFRHERTRCPLPVSSHTSAIQEPGIICADSDIPRTPAHACPSRVVRSPAVRGERHAEILRRRTCSAGGNRRRVMADTGGGKRKRRERGGGCVRGSGVRRGEVIVKTAGRKRGRSKALFKEDMLGALASCTCGVEDVDPINRVRGWVTCTLAQITYIWSNTGPPFPS
jgi:hypothetical protein